MKRTTTHLAASILAGALAFTAAASAQAAPLEFILPSHRASYAPTFGNGNFGATVNWGGTETLSSINYSVSPVRSAAANAYFNVSTTVFGTKVFPLQVQPESQISAENDRGGTYNPFYARGYAKATILGNVVYFASASTCTSAARHATYCTSGDQSLSKTLFHAEGSFTVGPIPVTVKADVTGNMHAGLSTYSDVSRYLGIGSSAFFTTTSKMNAGTYANAILHAFAGISGVLGVGVEANFKLIDISITPTSTQRGAIYDSAYTGSWGNTFPININSMAGSVSAWAQVSPFWRPSTTLVSWNAPLVYNTTLVNDTAQYPH